MKWKVACCHLERTLSGCSTLPVIDDTPQSRYISGGCVCVCVAVCARARVRAGAGAGVCVRRGGWVCRGGCVSVEAIQSFIVNAWVAQRR